MGSENDEIRDAIRSESAEAAKRLLPLVYDELRQLAHHHMRRESPGHSLQTTGLVHEAYLRLLGDEATAERGIDAQGRAMYLSAAAQAMRRILIDRARARGSDKRGGGRRRLKLFDLGSQLTIEDIPAELVDLDEALSRLAAEAPEQAELVSLRFFCGLTITEAAAVLEISKTKANRYWSFARAWLLKKLDLAD